MVTFSVLMTCTNGASETGDRSASARIRHGGTARADTRWCHRAARIPADHVRPVMAHHRSAMGTNNTGYQQHRDHTGAYRPAAIR
jgi:hypothetical protein